MSISHTGVVFFGTDAKPYIEPLQDSIVESVIKQFKDRSNVGITKYGKTMDRDDLSLIEWLEHTKQEQMDSVLYLEKAIKELKKQSLGWYDEKLEDRANIVGQNGNDGEHYAI